MRAYTVTKPGGTTDREFASYKDLLEEIGFDLSGVPRTREPGMSNRWLYVWQDRLSAERFARELAARTEDRAWTIREDLPVEDVGPLAPLDITADRTSDGTVFRLTPGSQQRIMRRFPNARLA